MHGRWLGVARAIWLALVIPSLGLFVFANLFYAPFLNPDKAVRAVLRHSDLSVSGYIAFELQSIRFINEYLSLISVLNSLSTLVWIAVGLLIFWRKSDDWMGLFAAFALIMVGLANFPQLYIMSLLAEAPALWQWPITLVNLLGWGAIGLFAYLFPNGRFVPQWMRWVAFCYLTFVGLWSLPSNVPFSTEHWPPPLLPSVLLGFLLAINYTQIYRYRRTSSMVERQQTKLVVYGFVITLLVDTVLFVIPRFVSPLAQPGPLRAVYTLISACLIALPLYLLPLTIGIAVLRYRLWDIDVLINKTLVYGSLTALLAGVYAGLILGLESLMSAVTGQPGQQPVIIVVSTLAIFVLFQPLRQRIQQVIDRRFYRRKYDAAKTLATFGATLRTETDLAELSNRLVAVIEETMQPVQVSLWLRPQEW